MSERPFVVTEYEQVGGMDPFSHYGTVRMRPVYRSCQMGLQHAVRFATALSYARCTYVSVTGGDPNERYYEWYFAGTLWNRASVPPIVTEREAEAPPYPIRAPLNNCVPEDEQYAPEGGDDLDALEDGELLPTESSDDTSISKRSK